MQGHRLRMGRLNRGKDTSCRAGVARTADVRLAVSEATTNAILHGYRGGPGKVQVSAGVRGHSLWVRVRDGGCGIEMHPGATSRSTGMGVGLGVIGGVVEELSVLPRRHGGTDLRMRFDLPGAGCVSPASRAQPAAA